MRVYRLLYGIGMETMRIGHRFGRRVSRRLCPVRRVLSAAFDRLVGNNFRRIKAEIRRIGDGFTAVKPYLAAHRGFGKVKAILSLPFKGVRRHPEATRTLLSWAVCIASIIVVVFCLNYWSHARYALAVTYNGEKIGYIADETVYDDATEMVLGRVVNSDDSFRLERVPSLSLSTVGKQDALLSKEELCDGILSTLGDSLAEMSGLYIDGNFTGALVSRNEILATLREIRSVYLEKDTEDERAEFVQNVEIIDGYFPISTCTDAATLKEKLTALQTVAQYYTVKAGDTLLRIARAHNMQINDLRALNPSVKNDSIHIGEELLVQRPQPTLQVKVVKTLRYTESIGYTTEKTYNTAQLATYQKVKRNGTNGTRALVAEVTYVDGMEMSRVIVSSTVTRQPVNRILEVGTQPVGAKPGQIVQGDGIATGSMMWPVPICRAMSRGFSRSHGGLDIANGPVTVNGKDFFAADGGVVEMVNTDLSRGKNSGGGYGIVVMIDHGNGLKTLYAHCSSLCVVAGQKVSKGQKLGTIGSTGQSTGPHLHFEVRRNGVRVNPLNYVNPKK